MRSTKSIVLIVIALACGLVASIGISQLIDRPDSDSEPKMETIYVAASNIPSWSELTPELLKQEEWPAGKVPQDAIRSIEEFEGKSPKYPLYPGEPIVQSKLTDGKAGRRSIRIPAGYQVVAVEVDVENALSGLISPGDKVDVLCFIRNNGMGTNISTGTRTILRNTTVFAVNDQIERQGEDSAIEAKTVSLLVQPADSERLVLAKQLGTIHLALRKPGDDTDMQTDGAKPGDLDASSRSDGNDGLDQSFEDDTQSSGGIFGLLDLMKDDNSTAVDSSSAAEAPEPPKTMVIMSPDGVLSSFTFANTSQKEGQLPALPTELMSDVESSDASFDDTGIETETSETEATEEEVGDLTEQEAEIDIDPAELGL
jgi:Flp pilus assembly protein CpaB